MKKIMMPKKYHLCVLSFSLLTCSLGGSDRDNARLSTEYAALSQECMNAARMNNDERVHEILALHPLLVNTQDNDGMTLLMWGAYWGNTAFIEKLIAADAFLDKQDRDGWTALMWASKCGYLSIVDKLLAYKASIHIQEYRNRTALDIAQINGYTAIVELLEFHASIEKEEDTLMVKPAH